MKILLLLILMPTLFSASIRSQTAPPLEIGVSQTLAKWRAANYSDVRYKLNITLEKAAPLMKGTITVSVKLTDEGAKNDLILDWRTTQFANDKDKPYANVVGVNNAAEILASTAKEHLIIPKDLLKTGENTIEIKFASPIKTSGAAITRYVDKEDGAEYIYSLFVPSDASTAFPVFDQPDLKARFQLNIVAPDKWNIVSNTNSKEILLLKEDGLAFGKYKNYNPTGSKELKFEETKPISTYVFAFAAGDFAEFTEYDEESVTNKMMEDQLAKRKETQKRRNQPELPEPSPLSRVEIDAKMGTRIYVRKSQAEKFKTHKKEVFRLNREGVKFLEDYFDYKFPFPKYDLVLIPEFPFGGMEHSGATFLRESSIIFPTEPTKNDLVSRANVIFHEAAHQWFGDTVTMRWFDDLWLKEGFAEFMAYKTLEKVMPEYNAWKIFYERNKQAAYLTDSTRGTTPIYQEIPNLSAAKSAYGNIVYRKAPSFLKQAEFYLGEKEFQTAVRQFLKKHEFANAEWTDLVKEFETASKDKFVIRHPGREPEYQSLANWGKNWVTRRGMPIIKFSEIREYEEGEYPVDAIKSLRVEVKRDWNKQLGFQIKQKNILNEGGSWLMAFKMLVIDESGKRTIGNISFTGDEEVTGFSVEGLKIPLNKWQFVFPNYQDYGYGIFLLDEKSRAYVLANIQNEKDDFLRALMWGALWDSVRETELAPQDYVELVVKNISVETDESTIQTLLGRVSTAMNYYLTDKQRAAFSERLETVIGEKMLGSNTAGQRLTFYRAYLNIASTERAAETLKIVLRENNDATPEEIEYFKQDLDKVKGQVLSMSMPLLRAKDKFDIVTKLTILGDKDAPKLLAELEAKEKTDEAKRYAYAAQAAIATKENKAKYWNDFTTDKNLSESYIESAFVVFNAPKQADLTLPYLEKALTELPNLKKNRKIFFVNGWLAAFIGGQKSEEALKIVNDFLAKNPTLDKDLRLKILENADGLERAVKIRAKFGK